MEKCICVGEVCEEWYFAFLWEDRETLREGRLPSSGQSDNTQLQLCNKWLHICQEATPKVFSLFNWYTCFCGHSINPPPPSPNAYFLFFHSLFPHVNRWNQFFYSSANAAQYNSKSPNYAECNSTHRRVRNPPFVFFPAHLAGENRYLSTFHSRV